MHLTLVVRSAYECDVLTQTQGVLSSGGPARGRGCVGVGGRSAICSPAMTRVSAEDSFSSSCTRLQHRPPLKLVHESDAWPSAPPGVFMSLLGDSDAPRAKVLLSLLRSCSDRTFTPLATQSARAAKCARCSRPSL